MKWELSEIKVGDAVRVNMGMYYHYGICTGDDRIVQFGYPIINPNANDVKVCATDVKTFLSGRFAEVMVLDKKELKTSNDIPTRIKKAESSIGEMGYNILHNNCEHFVNRCVFNNDQSNQVIEVQRQINELITPKVIYIAPVAMFANNNILPKYTKKELSKISNESLRLQKIAAYGLLHYAVEKSLGINDNLSHLKKTKTGKPIAKDYHLSISHTPVLVAVGVSKCKLGVDLQDINDKLDVGLIAKSMSLHFNNINDANPLETFSIWTKKEAIYKLNGTSHFDPQKIDHTSTNTKTIDFSYNDTQYILSVATDNINNIKIVYLFDNEKK